MKKINVKGILNPMSDKEMKNTTGGDNFKYSINEAPDTGGGGGGACEGIDVACNGYCPPRFEWDPVSMIMKQINQSCQTLHSGVHTTCWCN